jgi:uncharacterized protein YjbI with pentapeptide repeats
VIGRLISGKELTRLGLGEIDGRVDLRGLVIPRPETVPFGAMGGLLLERATSPFTRIEGVSWEGLDFSWGDLSGIKLHHVRIRNCLLNGTGFSQVGMWGTEVADTSFTNSFMVDTVLGSLGKFNGNTARNQWNGVNFIRADLRDAVFHGADFADCRFEDCNLAEVQMGQCNFTRVTFSGLLREVTFDSRDIGDRPAPKPLIDVDFSSAVFSFVAFRGTYLERVAFPDLPGLRVIPDAPRIARRQLALLGDDPSEDARMVRHLLEDDLKWPGPDDSVSIWYRSDWVQSIGESFANLYESLLDRALEGEGA